MSEKVLTVGELRKLLEPFKDDESVYVNIACDEEDEVYPLEDVSGIESPCVLLASDDLVMLSDGEPNGIDE